MVAKPYAPSHIASVASVYCDMRISGDVKQRLVELCCDELDRYVPTLEAETLQQDPERKTLDDPFRARLNYNRTRELMIDRISNVDSVGSAAVQAGVEHLEQHLAKILKHCEAAAAKERVGTIKPRHLELALEGLNLTNEEGDEPSVEKDEATMDFVASQSGGIVTASSLLSMARSMAKMTVTKEALEELLDTYTMVLEELESDIRQHAQLGSNPVHFIESINKMRGLMSLGWMRGMLMKAAGQAREQGLKTIDVEHIIHIDPFA